MKKTIIVLISSILLCSGLKAQDKYEITKVDILSKGRVLSASQISVMGVSIGDLFSKAISAIGKTQKNVTNTGTVYVVEYGKDEFRYVSRDNRVVTAIYIFPNFKKRLIGKTAELFDIMSPDRMRDFLIQNFGPPDYVNELEVMKWRSYIYSGGIVFNSRTDNSINLEDQAAIEESIKNEHTVKMADFGRPVEKPSASKSAGFRNSLWGMTKEQVRKNEIAEFLRSKRMTGDLAGLELLTFMADIGGNSLVAYYFADDTLTRARYIMLESHSDENLYIQDFNKIKSQLTDKYGAPARDQKLWSNELFKDDPTKYGIALASGHVVYVAEWYPPETSIQMLMKGDNYKVSLWVEYTGDKFAKYEKDFIKRSKANIW